MLRAISLKIDPAYVEAINHTDAVQRMLHSLVEKPKAGLGVEVWRRHEKHPVGARKSLRQTGGIGN